MSVYQTKTSISNCTIAAAHDTATITPLYQNHTDFKTPLNNVQFSFMGLWTILIIMMITLNGCAAHSKRSGAIPSSPVPEKWSAPFDASGKIPVTGQSPITGWITHFNDPSLQDLIEQGLKKNMDLKILATRFENAAANARIAGAERLFKAEAGLSMDQGENVVEFGDFVTTPYAENYGLSATLSWELDVWGRLRDEALSAKEDLIATELDIYGGKLSLVGQIARMWCHAITAKLRLDLAKENLKNRENSNRIVNSQYQSGITTALDLRLSLTEVALAENSVHEHEQNFSKAKRDLKLVLGAYPDDKLKVADNLPEISTDVPMGIPSHLLERRPDILSAKHRLMAADHRVSASKKNFLPRISLTQRLGRSSSELKNILDAEYSFWNLVGNLFQPIFQGGRIKAAFKSSKADAQREYITFGQTVLSAFSEVEASLTSEFYMKKQEVALEKAVKHSKGAEKLALEQYASGVVGIIEVLNSQKRVLDSKAMQITIKNARLQSRINLYLALGGKW